MAANGTLHAGHDVAYFTSGPEHGGCAGAMSYYTAAGEPPGEWAGKGIATLGLAGQVDPDVIARLYRQGTGPGGQQLVTRHQSKVARKREQRWPRTWRSIPAPARLSSNRVRAAERSQGSTTGCRTST